jgi:Icc-related predicted phosphoesterase
VTRGLFVSDLHGRLDRYQKLLAAIEAERPQVVFLGGDLLPFVVPFGAGAEGGPDFLVDWLAPRLDALRSRLGPAYPRVLAIFGNDDPRSEESKLLALQDRGLLEYAHARRLGLGAFTLYGYACVPPTPFRLKDWERYDVSRFVDPGSVSPEEGRRSLSADVDDVKWGTIAADLERLVGKDELSRAVCLFHSPPYATPLDRAALDGRAIDRVPLDVHVGSIAIRRFIEARQPLVTLHGHVHESARLTGRWSDRIGRTVCLSAAHDGPELALVALDLEAPERATRRLV